MASISKIQPKKQAEAGTVHWLNEAIKRGKVGVFSEVVTVTPGLAGELLRRNEGNRNIRPIKSSQYAQDMKAGRWALNGEPIIVADTGELNDGQHRLGAVIDANVSIPLLFVFGVPRETRKTVDQGAARAAGDFLAMDGVKNSKNVAALARLVMGYEASGGQSFSRPGEFTNAQVRARVLSDEKLVEAGEFTMTVTKFSRGILRPAMIGALYYILSDVHHDDAREYLNQICIGENIKRGDPAFAVRSALSGDERVKGSAAGEVVLRGWNAFRSGRRLMLAKRLGNLPALV